MTSFSAGAELVLPAHDARGLLRAVGKRTVRTGDPALEVTLAFFTTWTFLIPSWLPFFRLGVRSRRRGMLSQVAPDAKPRGIAVPRAWCVFPSVC